MASVSEGRLVASSPGTFVAREHQLGRLGSALAGALAGAGSVRFVVGDAGAGKTALVRNFAKRAQQAHDDLVVALGRSDAETGIGDPYLPFRELLAQLTGAGDPVVAGGVVGDQQASRLRRFFGVSGEAVVELGPELIGAFVPGAGLATKAAAYLAKKTGRLDHLGELAAGHEPQRETATRGGEQSHILEQYTNVITHLAGHQPLLLVLDDLQWADAASTGMLFRLGRTIGESRVLLVGTYRPAEVAIGRSGERHPLEKVVNELTRYLGDITIDLDDIAMVEGRRLVDRLIDSEPHELGEGFRRALFERTGGHPLFTVELLRSLQERGGLVTNRRGRWVEGDSLDWNELPSRVEGVIEERIGRLDGTLRDTLTIASVEGEDFTAEVVAAASEVSPRETVARLGRELERRHRLVRTKGLRRLDPENIRLSSYCFEHNLFQRYLYGQLDAAERAYLHEDVGTALEALCAGHAEEFAVQLARHFSAAGAAGKAAHYFGKAGEQALAAHANQEAVTHLTRALALTPEAHAREQFDLLAARETAHRLLGDEQGQTADLALMAGAADRLGDTVRSAEVSIRRAALANATGEYSTAVSAAAQAVDLAATTRAIAHEARALIEWGRALDDIGQQDDAERRFAHALALAESAALHRIQATSLRQLAWLAALRGEHERAAANFREVVRICRRLGDLSGEAKALNGLAVVAAMSGALDAAGEYFEQSLERERRIGDRRSEGRILQNLGELALRRHEPAMARKRYDAALRISRLTGDQPTESAALAGLGEAAARIGVFADAAELFHRSLAISEPLGELLDVGVALARLGWLECNRGAYEEALVLGRRALGVAGELGNQELEGDALEVIGLAFENLERWSEAAQAHSRALLTRSEAGTASIGPAAGLARVELALGDVAAAQSHLCHLLHLLDGRDLEGVAHPGAVYLTAWRVLDAAGDPQGATVLAAGAAHVLRVAERIGEAAAQRVFLDVPENRALTALHSIADRAASR